MPIDDLKPFALRREAFVQGLGKALAIVPAAAARSPFRQDADFFYLTGFEEPDAVAVFRPDGGFVLFVRPKDEVAELWDGVRAGPSGAVEQWGADEAYPLAELDDRLASYLPGCEAIAYSFGNSAHDARVTRLLGKARAMRGAGFAVPSRVVDPDATLTEMRLRKTPDEIERLRRACEATVAGHLAAMEAVAPGRWEYEIQGVIENSFRQNGSRRNAFETIVASGSNACVLHYVTNDSRMSSGEMVLIDAGAEVDFMCGDVTRTFPVSGRLEGVQRDVYEIVLRAQEAAIAAVRPGALFGDFDAAARRVLAEGLVELGVLPRGVDESLRMWHEREFYPHGTGHWLGQDTHDVGDRKVARKWRPLEPGMVVTVEPGLYFAPTRERVKFALRDVDEDAVTERRMRLGIEKARRLEDEEKAEAEQVEMEVPETLRGIGVRIEDDVLVTESGGEVLTPGVPKDPDVFGS